jgi:hypothetical protein
LYITDIHNDEKFANVKSLLELSIKLVDTNKIGRHAAIYITEHTETEHQVTDSLFAQ